MAGTLAIIALVLAAVLATILLWRTNDEAVRGAVSIGERLRFVFGILFLALAAWHLVQSGNPLYMLAAVIGVMFLTGYALVERPWEDTI